MCPRRRGVWLLLLTVAHRRAEVSRPARQDARTAARRRGLLGASLKRIGTSRPVRPKLPGGAGTRKDSRAGVSTSCSVKTTPSAPSWWTQVEARQPVRSLLPAPPDVGQVNAHHVLPGLGVV